MSLFLERLWRMDWIILGCVALLAAAGLVSLASSNDILFRKQLVWYGLATLVILIGSQINWDWLRNQIWFRGGLYWFSIALLAFATFQAETVRGTKSWIVVGGMQFEPAEIAKLALIIVLAGFFSRRHIEGWTNRNILVSFLYMVVPTSLIALHPDFGSASVMILIWVSFLLMSGINKKRLVIGVVLALTLMILMWSFFLKPYQKDRIKGFFLPEFDPLGVNYNVIQSKIAIGSAGFWGKGFESGTQTQLHFLPEAQTDFIYSAFIEEWGIIGGIIIALTFLTLTLRIKKIGLKARNNGSKFMILGIGVVFLIQFFINVGSAIGLVPVTGLTLPFVSYGGSSVLTFSIFVSIIQNIKIESSV